MMRWTAYPLAPEKRLIYREQGRLRPPEDITQSQDSAYQAEAHYDLAGGRGGKAFDGRHLNVSAILEGHT